MKRPTQTSVMNVLALVSMLALVTIVAATTTTQRTVAPRRDARGEDPTVVARRYERIASASVIADRILLELCEPPRIIGFSRHGMTKSSFTHQLAGKTEIDPLLGLEQIIALRPDLLIINNLGDPRRVARLMEAGIEVLDLGTIRGLDTLLEQIALLATVIGHKERGQILARRFASRLKRIAAATPEASRPRALFLVDLGNQLFGGTIGTSYHEVITHAGLIDAAAERHRDWPRYNIEELLTMNPELIVTKTGHGRALCARPGLARLAACRAQNAIIELPEELIDEPGLTMLEAAETLHELVHR